jgi:tetratricopeptide (TPR) repeat protein
MMIPRRAPGAPEVADMPDQDPSRDYELADQLAEEFARRYARGERPSVKEYCDRYPELADLLPDLLPAMAQIEQVKEGLAGAEDRPAAPPAPPARQLGDFHILREVGRGGMGVVYEAEQLSLGRRVALKVLTQQQLRDAKQKRRFEREAKAAARLHHTNIVPVFGTGEHEATPYYVMQFIQGMGLDEVIEELGRMAPGSAALAGADGAPAGPRDPSAQVMARSLMTGVFQGGEAGLTEAAAPEPEPAAPPPAVAVLSRPEPARAADTPGVTSSVTLPGQGQSSGGGKARRLTYWQSVAKIGVQVADALEYAHKQGVLHRDIQPSNLLLDLRGTVWVTDFGLAKAEGGENLTHTGDIIGTLRYMPPEAFDGKADARGDIYSLALTLYELAALRPAFDERDRNRLIKQVTTQEPEPVGRLRRGVPRDLETVIHKAIDRDPARRYRTAGELAADLQRFVDDEPIQARRQTLPERYVRWARHNPGIAVLGAALSAVLVLATVASLVAAGRMSRLAALEAKAADDERAARREAEEAEKREAREREHAEQARKAADESRAQAVKALEKAEENYARARAAVNDYLTAVSDDDRLKAPGLGPLRAQLLQSALGFYQDFLKERGSDPALRRELAAVYLKVGGIYSDLRRPQPADQSFARAQRLYEALAAEAPDDPAVLNGLALSLLRQGQNERAAAIWEKLIRPDDPRYHYDLSWAYSNLAMGADKEPPKKLEFLRKALAVRERLVRLRPDDPEARIGLAASLNNIAAALSSAAQAEQLPLYRRAAEEIEVAYRLRPNDPFTAHGVVILVRNVASVARALGHADEALAGYRRVVEVLDRRARDNPDVPGTAAEMVSGYHQLVSYLRELGRLDEAARVAERGHERIAEAHEETEAFFLQASSFEFAALALAEARAKAAPDGEATREREAAAAVAGLRRRAFFAWRDANWLRTNPTTRPLRGRADFNDLLARAEELSRADAVVRDKSAGPADKLAARRAILANLEALAGPLPTARYVRRSLAQARQDLGQALLDASQADEARAAFDEARAVRQRLVEEAPKDEQLRADLAVSQTAAGDLLARAGKLADAAKTWEAGLATLEAALKANPNSIPFQTALQERLLHVADQYAYTSFGLWDRAARHYRRAFEIQTPTQFVHWLRYAVVLAEIGDTAGSQKLAELASAVRSKPSGDEELALARTVLLAPSADARRSAAVKELASNFRFPAYVLSERHVRGVAHLRLGEGNEARAQVADNPYPWEKWPVVALAEHLVGHADAAREALRQADVAIDDVYRRGVSGGGLDLPLYWYDWLRVRALWREAHRAIHGKPPSELPYERLHQARLLVALDRPQEAEAEFAAAVALRPDDPEVWQTRARLFIKLGRKEQAAADLVHAQALKAADPKAWVETGRVLTELGEHDKADAAFARAAAAGKGAFYPFLEAGWWVAGPYPEPLDLACPPEFGADPSRPVAAVGENRDLNWRPVATAGSSSHSHVDLGPIIGEAKKVSYYALAYAYADRDRTATLHLRLQGGDDARLWVNGRLVCGGFKAWKLYNEGSTWIPVSLRAGRNAVLVKISHAEGAAWYQCQFHDHPLQQAFQRLELGAWGEAADAFAQADRRAAVDVWRYSQWLRCLAAAGRSDEYRRGFAESLRRHAPPGAEWGLTELANSCYLPPEKTAERERWVRHLAQLAEKEPNVNWRHYQLANAYLRAGRFEEAERSVRKAIQLGDWLPFRPLLATTLHYLGRADEARATLRKAEEQYARLVAEARKAGPFRLPQESDGELIYQATVREARALILGPANAVAPDVEAVVKQRSEWLARTDRIEDDFVRLVKLYPDQPRLWIDHGRRLGGLGKWDEAAKAFGKAVELAPKSPQVWKERGRAYAELGKWDEAAADLSKALDLTPEPKPNFPYYPWQAGRGGIDDLAARWDEVFDRLAKLRPKDVVLWARRVEHFAEAGRWAEAEATLRQVVERFPDDWWAPTLLAKLLLRRGDVVGFTEVSKRALERFAGTTDDWAAVNLVRTALLAPADLHDSPPFQRLLRTVTGGPTRHFWMQVTPALVDYRRGDAAAAVRRLTTEVKPDAGNINLEAFTDAVRALAYQKAGQQAEARDALARARTALERHRPRPDRGWAYDWNWPNWVEVEILVREIETMIPVAVAAAAPTASPAQEENARRERKARADRLSTEYALVLIRLDVGQKAEAEAELRKVLTERAKLAAEEPNNPEYAGQVADTRLALGRLLTDAGRPDEGLAEARQAVAIREKLAAEPPKTAQAREALALVHFAIGGAAWKSGRLADGYGAWQKGLALLEKSAPDRAGGAGSGVRLRQRRQEAAQALAKVGLWREAAPFWSLPGKDEVIDTLEPDRPWLRLLAGDAVGYRQACQDLVWRLGTQGSVHDRCFAAWAGALADPMGLDKGQALSWAQEAVAAALDNADLSWRRYVHGLVLYRAGRFQEAKETLEIANRDTGWPGHIICWPVLAMSHHRLGHAAEARRWLDKASTEWLRLFPVARGGDGLTLVPARQHDHWDRFFHDCMTVEILLREASLLITGTPSVTEAYCRVHAGGVYLRLGERDKAEAEFRAAFTARPDDPVLWLARSRAYAAAGQPEKAAVDFARAMAVAEEALARRPGDADAAGRLADVLLEKAPLDWKVVKPARLKSDGGATLTVQPDGSVLASGTSPDRDVYTVEAEVEGPVSAVRLEALADDRLPNKGPGRHQNGNFHLNDVRVTVTPGGALAWSRAFADHEQTNGYWVRNAIDASPNTAWGISPKMGEPHWAVFVARKPAGAAGRVRITVRLDSGDKIWVGTTLGRFRLSVTAAPAAWLTAEDPAAAPTSPKDCPWTRLGVALARTGADRGRAAAAFAQGIRVADSAEQVRQRYQLAIDEGVTFDELARARPDDARLWLAHGRARAEAGDARGADAAFTTAARLIAKQVLGVGWWAIGR